MPSGIAGQLLTQVNHLQTLLKATTQGKVQNATIVTYGVDGKTEATQTQADYTGMNFDEQGNSQGGVLQYSTQAQGKALSQSTAHLGNDGKPVALASTIYDRHTGDQHAVVNVDFGGLQWNPINNIQAGDIKVTSTKPQTQQIVTAGSIAYANEQLTNIDLTHYAPDGSGNIHGYTKIGYDQTQFLGNEIIGGHVLITNQRSDQSLSSQSKLTYSATGLPLTMETQGFGLNGTELGNTTVLDYSALEFDPLGHIFAGTLPLKTQNQQGVLLTQTLVTFANGVPQNAKTQNFSQQGKLLNQIETDYTNAQFNHNNHVINSTITVKTLRLDGSLASIAKVQYGGDGKPIKHQITNYHTDGQKQVSQTEVDYSEAGLDHNRQVIQGKVTSTTTFMDDPKKVVTVRHYQGTRQALIKETLVQSDATDSPSSVKTIKRPDGTLAEVITQIDAQSANITQYAIDGKTIIKSYQVDYSKVQLNETGTIIGGNVTMNVMDGNQRLLATSNLNYVPPVEAH